MIENSIVELIFLEFKMYTIGFTNILNWDLSFLLILYIDVHVSHCANLM